MKRDELLQLIDQAIDGSCSEADFVRLEAQLHVDSEARKIYYQRIQLHTLLEVEVDQSQRKRKSVDTGRFFSKRALLYAAAAVLICFAIPLLLSDKRTTKVAVEPSAAGFGVVAQQDQTQWQKTQPLNNGDLIPAGRIELTNGLAQLELFSGVRVILQGPAEFELHSDMEMTVHSGKLRAIVPKPARGFRVNTTNGEVVDLGTEFALDVQPGHAELHVYDGEIEWHPVADQVQKLVDGESLRWTDAGATESAIASSQFAGLDKIASIKEQRYSKWLSYSNELKNDSRLLAYFPMTQTGNWNRQLMDQSTAANHGTIVRAQRSLDRWGNDKALNFTPTGSRVRVDIPGEHESITLFCWARIDSLDKWYNSLFLTDGHELNEPHWQIMDDGRLFFSVKRRTATKQLEDKKIVYSPPIWTPQLSGQWFQIAAVYDGQDQSISHYLNGKRIAHEVLPEEFAVDKVRIGAASIANWSEPIRTDPKFAVRNLNGVIDEFAVFGTALNESEINQLYQIGKP